MPPVYTHRIHIPLAILAIFCAWGLSLHGSSLIRQIATLLGHEDTLYRWTYSCDLTHQMRQLLRDPLVLMLDDFLKPGEAEYLIRLAKPRLEKSFTVSSDGQLELSTARTSSSARLGGLKDDPVVECVKQRALHFSNDLHWSHQEVIQVVWYEKGQQYVPHFDWLPHESIVDPWGTEHGQRWTTLLVYLNEEFEGGETVFPMLGLRVQPKKNSALVFYNLDEKDREDRRTLHGGSPVTEGEKWAINIWQRKMTPTLQKAIAARQSAEGNDTSSPQQGICKVTRWLPW